MRSVICDEERCMMTDDSAGTWGWMVGELWDVDGQMTNKEQRQAGSQDSWKMYGLGRGQRQDG